MAHIITVNGKTPIIHESCFIAPDAVITGDIEIGVHSSVWFKVVMRGDVCRIRIGERVNIQDAAIIHGTTGLSDTVIGNNVSIGHQAIVHGAVLHDNCLIGMGAIVLDNAIVQSNVVVAAGAVVTMGSVLESGYIYAGTPAKKIKPLDPDQANLYLKGTADGYVEFSKWYK